MEQPSSLVRPMRATSLLKSWLYVCGANVSEREYDVFVVYLVYWNYGTDSLYFFKVAERGLIFIHPSNDINVIYGYVWIVTFPFSLSPPSLFCHTLQARHVNAWIGAGCDWHPHFQGCSWCILLFFYAHASGMHSGCAQPWCCCAPDRYMLMSQSVLRSNKLITSLLEGGGGLIAGSSLVFPVMFAYFQV